MLAQVLPQEAFGFLLVMTRLIGLVMLMPGLGDQSIPARIRVSLGVVLSLVVFGAVRNEIPPIPATAFGLAGLLLHEALVGILIALVARIFMAATHTAGTIIAFQTGLAAAQSFDPTQGSQGAIIGTFMTLMSITLVMVTDTHHLMILGMVSSYDLFGATEAINFTDFARIVTHYVGLSFEVGLKLSAPFILYGIIYNVALGLIARMMPQFQVFFIGMPLNIYLGFALFMVVLASTMQYFIEHLRALLMQFLG